MRKGRSQMAPCRWRRHRADAMAGVMLFHAELCRAHLGFLFLFFPSQFIPSYAKGETPLGLFAQGGGGPLPPPTIPRPTCHAQWVMGG